MNFAFVDPARTRGLAEEMPVIVPHHHEYAVIEHRPGAIEGAARDHVDRTGQRGAGQVRRGRVNHLQPRDVVHRNGVEIYAARGAAARHARDVETANGDWHIFGRHSAQRDGPRGATDDINRDAREIFQEVAWVAFEHAAELVCRNDVDDIGGETLLVDRDRGSVHFLGRGDDEIRELHDAPAEFEVASGGGAGGHRDRGGFDIETREERLDRRRTRRHLSEPVATARIGEGFERRAFDRDPRPFDEITGAQVDDASLDRAGGGRLGQHRRREKKGAQRARPDRDETESGFHKREVERSLVNAPFLTGNPSYRVPPFGLLRKAAVRCVQASVARRKSRHVIDAIRSPGRERRDIYVGTFSLSSRSGLQPEILILYVSQFMATYTRTKVSPMARTADGPRFGSRIASLLQPAGTRETWN